MATVTDRPSAVGNADAWTLGAGATKVAAVAGNDGDTTYIFRTGVASQAQHFSFAAIPGDAVDPLTSVTMQARCRAVVGTATLNIDWNNSSDSGQTVAVSASYTLYSRATAISGADLAIAVANGDDHGVTHTGTAAGTEQWCTEIIRTAVYTQNSPGFAFFFQWLLPLLGPGLDYATFQRAITYLGRVHPRRPRFTDDEAREMWCGLRAWAWRRYSLPVVESWP